MPMKSPHTTDKAKRDDVMPRVVNAVTSMAEQDGPLRERLRDAWVTLAPLLAEEFPRDISPRFAALRSRMNTIGTMSDEEMRDVAKGTASILEALVYIDDDE